MTTNGAGGGDLDFRVLGPLEVDDGGRPVRLGGRQQRAVLARLLLDANRVVSSGRLVEELWGDRPPEKAAGTLQVYVFHLRAALEPDRAKGSAGRVLVTRDPGYLLRASSDQVDSACFERLLAQARDALRAGRPEVAAGSASAGLGLWRGPVLADLVDYAFTQVERVRLEELRLVAVEYQLEAEIGLGRHVEAIGRLEALIGEHPLRERLHGQLMLALYRAGHQADALAAYRRAHKLLADELGLDPNEDLRRLETAILRHDPDLDWAPPSGLHRPAAAGRDSGTAPADRQMIHLAGPVDVPPAVPPAAAEVAPAPIDSVQVEPAAPQQVREAADATTPPSPRRSRLRRRTRWVATLAAGVVAAGTVTGVVVADRGHRILLAEGNVISSLTARGRVVAQLPVGNDPTAVTAADGTVWVTNTAEDTVSRIDPAQRRELVRIAGVGHHPSAIAVGDGTAWVVSPEDNTVTPINTTTQRTVGVSVRVGQRPSGVAVGAGRVWVTNSIDNTVVAIDPNDVQQVRTFPAGTGPAGIAVTGGAVWVTNAGDGTAWKLDPGTGVRLLAAKVGDDPVAVAVGASGVWVANYLSDTVTRLDPTTGQATTVPVGAGPSGIAVTDGAVWVTVEYAGQVVKIDPVTNRVTSRVAVAGAPHGIAALGNRLWLASGPSYLGHRGGQLRVRTAEMDDLEPAHEVPGAAFVPSLTHDGLVSYAHTAGAVGATIVADLADAVPARTGTVYVFHLRPGIRYDTGQPVQARDVRYSFERLFRGGERGFASRGELGFTGIVGAAACVRRPATCDLSQGVQTDDNAGIVRIRLTRPNPLFLNRLAELFLVVPYRTPITGRSRGPVPGTGPYTVTRFVPSHRVELRRNRYFRQWSRAAQPDGYPDSIVVDVGAITAATVAQITRGQLDFVQPSDATDLPPATVRTAALSHRLQLFDGSALAVGMAILNTRLPPFNDPRVRKALNYAVDRNELARRRMAIGLIKATPTCQVLIPGIGGYRPYCPYTIDHGSGRWLAPDLTGAAELVRESGTAGQPVTVWEPTSRYDPDGAYFVEVLTALGYKAHLHTPRPDFFTYIDEVLKPGRAQLTVLAWTSPPGGDDLTQHLLCRSFDAKHHNFYSNYGGFCDPRIDREYDAAVRLAVTDPTAANQLWAQIDQQLVDAAPWVPSWNTSTTGLASPRVGNITPHFQYDILLDQLWVQ